MAGNSDSDTDWNMTVKGTGSWGDLNSDNKTDSIGYSEPINSVNTRIEDLNIVNGGNRDSRSPQKERETRSPTKERTVEVARARSPQKEISSSNLSPAKSESAIPNSVERKRDSRSLEHLNTAVDSVTQGRAREEERRRVEEEEKRRNEENERRRNEEERRRNEEERRRVEEERRRKEERRKSGYRDKSPSKQPKSSSESK